MLTSGFHRRMNAMGARQSMHTNYYYCSTQSCGYKGWVPKRLAVISDGGAIRCPMCGRLMRTRSRHKSRVDTRPRVG